MYYSRQRVIIYMAHGATGGGESKVITVASTNNFPNNAGQLYPSEYYSQFRDWYG